MQMDRGARTVDPATAIALVVAGGVLAIVAAVLPWARASAIGSAASGKGWDFWEGKTAAIFAAGMIVRAVLTKTTGKRALATMVMIGGAVVAAVALYSVFGLRSQIVNDAAKSNAADAGMTVDQARALLQLALDTGALKISLQFGVALPIVGGLVGIAGGASVRSRIGAVTPTIAGLPAPPGMSTAADGWASAPGPWITAPIPPPPAYAPQPPAEDEQDRSVPWRTVAVPPRTSAPPEADEAAGPFTTRSDRSPAGPSD